MEAPLITEKQKKEQLKQIYEEVRIRLADIDLEYILGAFKVFMREKKLNIDEQYSLANEFLEIMRHSQYYTRSNGVRNNFVENNFDALLRKLEPIQDQGYTKQHYAPLKEDKSVPKQHDSTSRLEMPYSSEHLHDLKKYELLTWEIPDEKLENWQCLHQSYPRKTATDCGANVLQFFDLLDRSVAEVMARNLNAQKSKGLTLEEFKNHLYTAISSDVKREYISINFNFTNDSRELLERDIPRGHGTSIFFRRDSGLGHVMIASVYKTGELLFLDPQQQTHYMGLNSINEMIANKKYVSFDLIFVKEKAEPPSQHKKTNGGKRKRRKYTRRKRNRSQR
jgi:hypothetical protein